MSEQYQRPGVVSIPIVDIDDVELALIWSSDHGHPAVAELAEAVATE